MPIHDFHCRDCDTRFEQLVRSDRPGVCPKCSGTNLDKLLSPIAPAGKSAAIIASSRARARREGHLSNE